MPIILKHKADPNLCYPNGESGAQFIARVRGFFSRLCEHNSGQNILIVTHFGVMETAARQFTGPPAYENIMIGVDDVWLMTFAEDLTVVKEVV
jgi:broad specificity phosphatase PhoE